MVQSQLFLGARARASEKKYPEPVKNGPAPQHGVYPIIHW